MTDSTVVVKSVSSRGVGATIEFEDGHLAVFVGYTYGWRTQIEGLRYFTLYKGDEPVVQYAGRLFRSKLSDKEHRFVRVADGYTAELVASYWEAAQTYLNEEYYLKPQIENRPGSQELCVPWILASAGSVDLDKIKAGLAPLPVLAAA